jgi:hypothetical protein
MFELFNNEMRQHIERDIDSNLKIKEHHNKKVKKCSDTFLAEESVVKLRKND